MGEFDMTVDERRRFLSDVRVGVLSVAREGRGPLSLPVWYQYEDGDVIIGMAAGSLKARLLARAGRATVTVQDETPPYRYVSVEGPVTIGHEERDPLAMPVRYLGDEIGRRYAERQAEEATVDSVVVRLTPETWLTCDYGKSR